MADADNRRIKSLKELKTAADLTDFLGDLKKHRARFEKDWKLNLAFYRGNQYSYIARSGRLESLPVEEGEKPRYRVRIVSNQIVTGAQSLLSKLTKTKPVISATPSSSSIADVKAAQMSEYLLEDWWSTLQLDDKLEEALLWGILGGQGYWKISWDPHAGTPMTFTMNPETGQPITSDEEKTMFKQMLTQVGLPEDYADETVYLGDVRIDVMSPFQVWLDPAAKTVSEAQYAICEHSLTPDEIKSRWGKDVEADSIPNSPDSSLPGAPSGESGSARPSVKKVYIGYFKPSAALPKGRYVVWVEEKQSSSAKNEAKENILSDTPWPYPFTDLPLVKFPGVRVPGSIYDDAITTAARPLQKELNRTISQIVEYKNLTIKPRVWAPIGSLKQKITSESGAIYEFQPIAGLKPEVEKLPALPPYVFEHLQDVNQRLRDVFNLTEVSEGSVPPNVEAGIAIDLLQEMATDRLAPTVKLIEVALAQAGKLLLCLAKEYYVEPRLVTVRGGGGSQQVKRFQGADIASGVDVRAEAGSGLPRTRAGRQARIERLIEMQVLPPHQAWKYLDIADMRSVAAKFAADEDQALREHEKLLKGEPLNQAAVSQAVSAIQSGMNPETGAPIEEGDDLQGILMRAALQPGPADNHAAHLDMHHDFIVSVEFETLPPQVQQAFFEHFAATQEAMRANAPIPEGQAPRISLSMHGTLGPTVAAKMMKQAGVDTTPEEFTEPPLETMVQDFVDQPGDAANNPLAALEAEQGLQQAADAHQLEMMNQLAQVRLSQEKVNTEQVRQEQMRKKPSGGKSGS